MGDDIFQDSRQPLSQAMDQPFIPFVSTWSLSNGFGVGDLDPAGPLPEAFGVHRVGFQSLGEGGGLFDATVLFTEPVKVVGTVTSGSRFLLLRLPLAGLAEVRLQDHEGLTETPERYGLFLHGRVDACTIQQRPGELSDIVAPMIAVDRLRTMLDGIHVPPVIGGFLDGCDDNFVAAPRMSAEMRHLARQLKACPYNGDLGNLYRQGKLFEAMVGLLGDLDDRHHGRGPVIGSEQAKVETVCGLLRHDLAHPPTMEALACRVGLSQRRLAEVFREVTGLTVIEWTVRQKLFLAADLLREDNRPVKEIAYRLGYSQVSSFTTAFSRQFGVAPAGYRRSVVSFHAVKGNG